MLTVREVAERFKVSPRTVHRWIKTGKLKAIKVDRDIRIQESEIERIIGGK